LQEFVRNLVFGEFEASCCVIAPSVRNTRAIRAYQKAGFRHVKTVRAPGGSETEYVMLLWPDEIDNRIAELKRRQEQSE
jgi:RimJ/RimL family protein N-acetyltransferase